MGGFTTVICEPNTEPPLDNCQMVQRWYRLSQRDAYVNLYTKVCITKNRRGERLTKLKYLSRRPWVVAATDDGNPVVNEEVMKRAFLKAKECNLLLTPHCEESPATLQASQKNQDYSTFYQEHTYYKREPYYVARELELAKRATWRVHVSHVSMGASLESIRKAKAEGVQVTCEVTPHHLTLSEQEVGRCGTDAKVNPPLRSREDVDALRLGIKDGIVDVIASDHAPHSPEEKARGWKEAPFGVIGLETTLGVVLTSLVHSRILSLTKAIALMSSNPAKILGIPGGCLAVGNPADITIIDLDKEWVVDPNSFYSKGHNTPFRGWWLKGKAYATIVGGKIVMKNGEVVI
jgi:dihydroorotase